MDQTQSPKGENSLSESKMEEKQPDTMESIFGEGDLTLNLPRRGEIRTVEIASISDTEILVSVGAKSEGIIPGKELDHLESEERAGLTIGLEIPVFVVNPEDQRGNLILSYLRAKEESDWQRAEDMMNSDGLFEGVVQSYNKGGLIVLLGRLRGFVPASQISLSRRMAHESEIPEKRWANMVGEPIAARVIEVDRSRRRLILSERTALQESRASLKDRLLTDLEAGEVRTGRVTSLADFGAFVNISGADGLVHLSEISWDRIQHPSELLKVGQEVEVKVISVDRDRRRIGLSIRQLLKDPWQDRVVDFRVGQLVEATITRLEKFGAFASLSENLEGLIHISELSDDRVEHPKEVINVGDVVTLRVIKIDMERRRIGLSIRKIDSPAYTDLDWKLELAEEVSEFSADEAISEEQDEPAATEDQTDAPEKEEVESEAEQIEQATLEDQADSAELDDVAQAEQPDEGSGSEPEEVSEISADEAISEEQDEPAATEEQADAPEKEEIESEAEQVEQATLEDQADSAELDDVAQAEQPDEASDSGPEEESNAETAVAEDESPSEGTPETSEGDDEEGAES